MSSSIAASRQRHNKGSDRDTDSGTGDHQSADTSGETSTPHYRLGAEPEADLHSRGEALPQPPVATGDAGGDSGEPSGIDASAASETAEAQESAQGEAAEPAESTDKSESARADQAEEATDEAVAEETEEATSEQADQEPADAEEAEQAPVARESRTQRRKGQSSGRAFLPELPIVRLGITTPLVHSPPKPSIERREEIRERTGMPPELHHAQIQDALNRTTQGARDAQRQMASEVEALAEDTRMSTEDMAKEIPGVVAACVAEINRVVDNTQEAVLDAGAKYAAHIGQEGVLVGEQLQQNREDTTAQIFKELQDGADHIVQANQIVQKHFDANLNEAADKIEHLPDSGRFAPLTDPHGGNETQPDKPSPEGGGQSTPVNDTPTEGGEEGQAMTVSDADKMLTDWLPEGAERYNNIHHYPGLAGLVLYLADRTQPLVSQFLAPTDRDVRSGQVERLNRLNSEGTRGQFAVLALGLTAPVAESHSEDSNDTEDTADTQEEQNEEVLLEGVAGAQQQIAQRMEGVNRRLDESTRPKLTANVRKAGARIQHGLEDQSKAAESALLAAAAQMADAYRDLVERLKALLEANRFLDARSLIPKIQQALDSARALRDSHVQAAGEQAADTLQQLGDAKDQQVDSLWKLTDQSTGSLSDVIAQTRFDFMLFAEQMTGVYTDGRDDVLAQAAGYADKMAQNILRLAGRNDNEAIPRLESLSVSFLNSQITAAQNWQDQFIGGHLAQLKSSGSGFVSIWNDIVQDLNQRSRDIDKALPKSGASAGGAAASAVAGGLVGGPVGAAVGLGGYLWAKNADEDAVLNALGDLPPKAPPALKGVFALQGYGALAPRIEDTMSSSDSRRALALMSDDAGTRARARLEVARESTGWFSYNTQARESALRGMTKQERATLSESDIEALRADLSKDLKGTEETITLAYLEGNRQLALAARIEEARVKARRTGSRGARTLQQAERRGDQAAVDMVATINELARAEMAFESAYLTEDEVRTFTDQAVLEYAKMKTPEDERPPGGFSNESDLELAREVLIEDLTASRTFVRHQGHSHAPPQIETVEMAPEAERYIRDAINHGPGSDEAQESRAVYEIQRARDEGRRLSETSQLRLTQTLENPRLSDLQARWELADDLDPDQRAALGRQLAEEQQRHQERMLSLAQRLGAPASETQNRGDATDWVADELGELFAREGGEYGAYGQELIKRGRPTMVSAIALSTDKWGTHEDLLLHAYRGRTREEIEAVEAQWATARGEDLNEMLGIKDREWDRYDTASLALGPVGFFAARSFRAGETSGDVAMELQRLAQGPVDTDLAAANMAALKVDQQERGTGFIASLTMGGSSQKRTMEEHREQLGRLVLDAAQGHGDVSRFRDNPDAIFGVNGQLNPELQRLAFNADGSFRGDDLALRGQSHITGLAAENYQAEIDRQESILTTAISVLTIAVSIALLLIPGVNLVAAGIITALVGGALTMAAKQGMRGERYGWEEAATDMAQTGIEAATAGAAGALAGGLGRTGALAKIGGGLNKTFGKVGGAVVREAITGAVSNAAQTAIQDDTFKDGTERGLERLFNSALKGAAIGGISGGVSQKLSDSMDAAMVRRINQPGGLSNTPMQRAGKALGPAGRAMLRDGVSEAIGTTLGEGAGILVDYANGEYHGTFGDAMKHIGQAGLRDMVRSAGRAGVRAHNRTRFNTLMQAAREQGGNLSDRDARALRLAGISAGAMHYDTPLDKVRSEVQAGVSARKVLPPELRPLADTVDQKTLTQLMRGLEAGSFGTSKEALALARNIADQVPSMNEKQLFGQLNRGLRSVLRARAAEQAAQKLRQKELRNQLLLDMPGPVRADLARLPMDQLDAIPSGTLREAAEFIARGQFDPARAQAFLRAAERQRAGVDESAFLRNLLLVTDTSQRGQAALQARQRQLRSQLASQLPGDSSRWLSGLSDGDVQRLHGALQRGDFGADPSRDNALFKRVRSQHPELTRADFYAALRLRPGDEGGSRERMQGLARAGVSEVLQPVLGTLPQDGLLRLRSAQGEAGFHRAARHWLISAAMRENPRLDVTDFNRQLDRVIQQDPGVPVSRQDQVTLRRELLRYVPSAQRAQLADTPIIKVTDAEFRVITRSASGRAVTMIVDGKPVIVIRASADPRVLREEGIHLLQSREPEWAKRVGTLDERKLADWDRLPLREQMALYRNKVAIEIDAQQRLIHQLRGELGSSLDIRRRSELSSSLELARTTLANLQRRQSEVGAIAGPRLQRMEQGILSRPQWLDQPARLFSKQTTSATKDAGADALRQQIEASGKALAGSLDPGILDRLQRQLEQNPRALARVQDALTQLPPSLRSPVGERVVNMRHFEQMQVMAEGLAGVNTRLQNIALTNKLFRLNENISDLSNRQKLLNSANDIAELTARLGMSRRDGAEVLSRLLDLSGDSHQRFAFMESATQMLRVLATGASSPAGKQVLEHLTQALAGTPKAPGSEGADVQAAASKNLAADLQRVPRLLEQAGSPSALLTILANNLGTQGTLAGGDAVAMRVQLAAARWPQFARDHADFARMLESATPQLSAGQRALLADIQPWFNDIVQSQWFKTLYPQSSSNPAAAQRQLLNDLMTQARLGTGPVSDNSADALRSRLERAVRDTAALTLTTEFVTSQSGRVFDQEMDFYKLIGDEMRALGLSQDDIAKRFDNLEQHWAQARAEGKVIAEDHLYNLLRQRTAYQAMVDTASRLADDHVRALDQSLTPTQRNQAREAEFNRLTQGLKQKLTEVSGEIAATRHMMVEAPGMAGFELMRGFEAGIGFDQVWVRSNPNGTVEIVIAEAKGFGATLQEPGKGTQMSHEWVARTVGDMILRSQDPATATALYDAFHQSPDKVRIRGVVITAGDDASGTRVEPAPGTLDADGTYSLETLRYYLSTLGS